MKFNYISLVLFFLMLIFSISNIYAKQITTHYESGKIEQIYQIGTDGKKEGLYQLFDEDGDVIKMGPYEQDLQHGRWHERKFDNQGNTVGDHSGNYEKGIAVGKWVLARVDGYTLVANYDVNGNLHGINYLVDKYGELVLLYYMVDGENKELCNSSSTSSLSDRC